MSKSRVLVVAVAVAVAIAVVAGVAGYQFKEVESDYDIWVKKSPTAAASPSVPPTATADAAFASLKLVGTPGIVVVAIGNIDKEGSAGSDEGEESPGAETPGTTGDRWLRFALWILLFGGAAGLMLLVFGFLADRAKEFNATLRWLTKRDIMPEIAYVSGEFRPLESLNGFGDDTLEKPISSTLSGPSQLVVGDVGRYSVKLVWKDDQKPATDVVITWVVVRPDSDTKKDKWEPETGEYTYLTPGVEGKLHLSIFVNGYLATIDPLIVSVVPVEPAPKPSPRPQLPIYGQGWASFALAVVLILALIVLALENVLSGEAVAPILGTIAGYIFGQGVQASKESE